MRKETIPRRQAGTEGHLRPTAAAEKIRTRLQGAGANPVKNGRKAGPVTTEKKSYGYRFMQTVAKKRMCVATLLRSDGPVGSWTVNVLLPGHHAAATVDEFLAEWERPVRIPTHFVYTKYGRKIGANSNVREAPSMFLQTTMGDGEAASIRNSSHKVLELGATLRNAFQCMVGEKNHVSVRFMHLKASGPKKGGKDGKAAPGAKARKPERVVFSLWCNRAKLYDFDPNVKVVAERDGQQFVVENPTQEQAVEANDESNAGRCLAGRGGVMPACPRAGGILALYRDYEFDFGDMFAGDDEFVGRINDAVSHIGHEAKPAGAPGLVRHNAMFYMHSLWLDIMARDDIRERTIRRGGRSYARGAKGATAPASGRAGRGTTISAAPVVPRAERPRYTVRQIDAMNGGSDGTLDEKLLERLVGENAYVIAPAMPTSCTADYIAAQRPHAGKTATKMVLANGVSITGSPETLEMLRGIAGEISEDPARREELDAYKVQSENYGRITSALAATRKRLREERAEKELADIDEADGRTYRLRMGGRLATSTSRMGKHVNEYNAAASQRQAEKSRTMERKRGASDKKSSGKASEDPAAKSGPRRAAQKDGAGSSGASSSDGGSATSASGASKEDAKVVAVPIDLQLGVLRKTEKFLPRLFRAVCDDASQSELQRQVDKHSRMPAGIPEMSHKYKIMCAALAKKGGKIPTKADVEAEAAKRKDRAGKGGARGGRPRGAKRTHDGGADGAQAAGGRGRGRGPSYSRRRNTTGMPTGGWAS